MYLVDEQHSELELTEHGFFSSGARGKWLCHPLHFPSFLRFPHWKKARTLRGAGGLLCAWNQQKNLLSQADTCCLELKYSNSSLFTSSLLPADSSCQPLILGVPFEVLLLYSV